VNQRKRWLRVIDQIGPLLGLIAIAGVFGVMRPGTFLTWANFEIILLHTAVVGVAALGATLIIISSGIDLSVGSMIAVTAVGVALLLNAGAPPAVAVGGGVAIGGLCGLLNGSLITFGKITPFIVTLGTLGALRGAAKGMADEQMIVVPNQGWLEHILRPLRAGEWWVLPVGVWVMLILAVACAVMLRYTRFGRHIIALGSNEETARLCGVRVGWVKLNIYLLGGLLAGAAGVLQFSRDNVGNPTTAFGYELDVIAAVVIGGGSLAGGQGSILGTIVGALIMSTIANGCTKLEMSNWVQEIITGGIIVLAVALDRFRHQRAG
jgi:ribose transport system permease protein